MRGAEVPKVGYDKDRVEEYKQDIQKIASSLNAPLYGNPTLGSERSALSTLTHIDSVPKSGTSLPPPISRGMRITPCFSTSTLQPVNV